MDTGFSAPHRSRLMTVEPAWIDYNGHLNMAYYNVLFDRGADELFALIGIGPDYARSRQLSTFSAEFHVCYLRELKAGDRVYVESQLLDYDEKRFHFFQTLWHEEGWVSATGEGLGLHVDLAARRVAPMPADVLARLEALHAAHARLPRPERAGRRIGIPRANAESD